MTAHVSRQAASKLTIVGLVVAAGGVMGVAALAIGGEGALPAPPAPPQEPSESEGQPQEVDQTPKRDPLIYRDEVEWTLNDYYQFGEQEDEIVQTPGEGETPGQTPSQGPAPIRYLGSIIGPQRKLAIVSIDGQQRILAENAEVNGYRLLRVDEDRIVVRRGNATPSEISKAPSDGSMVTMIAGSPSKDDGPLGVNRGEDVEDNLTRTERLRQEALERQRERLGTRDERLQEIERRRSGGASGASGAGGANDARNTTTAAPPRNPGGSTSPGGSFNRSSGGEDDH